MKSPLPDDTRHISGVLRSIAYAIEELEVQMSVAIPFKDEGGVKQVLSVTLHEIAEQIDDAHEEWLEQEVEDLMRQR